MSFFDDILPILGGAGGFMLGGLPGAMIGAGAGNLVGNVTRGQPNNPYNDLSYVGPPPGVGLTAKEVADAEKMRRHTAQAASGAAGALEQSSAARSGGTSKAGSLLSAQNVATQSALERNSDFGLGLAGQASERDAQNRAMVNHWNTQHAMLKSNYDQQADYANAANRSNLFGNIGAYGMYMLNNKNPWSGYSGKSPENWQLNDPTGGSMMWGGT